MWQAAGLSKGKWQPALESQLAAQALVAHEHQVKLADVILRSTVRVFKQENSVER
jgi:hypothetical protein